MIAILALMGPAVIAASTTQVNVLINSMFASTLGDGAIFWLAIAFRLMQLPLGLFGVALGTVTLPLLSRLVVAGEMGAFRARARARHAAHVPVDHSLDHRTHDARRADHVGALPARQVRCARGGAGGRRAAVLRRRACGYAALKVLVNAFYALDRRKTPMVVSFLAVGLNLLFNWIFTFRLGWGHRGLAFSTGLRRDQQFLAPVRLDAAHLGSLESRRMLVTLVKIGLAGAALAAVCAASNRWFLADWATQAFWRKTLVLLATVAAAGSVFGLCAAALKVEELTALLHSVARRLRPA